MVSAKQNTRQVYASLNVTCSKVGRVVNLHLQTGWEQAGGRLQSSAWAFLYVERGAAVDSNRSSVVVMTTDEPWPADHCETKTDGPPQAGPPQWAAGRRRRHHKSDKPAPLTHADKNRIHQHDHVKRRGGDVRL